MILELLSMILMIFQPHLRAPTERSALLAAAKVCLYFCINNNGEHSITGIPAKLSIAAGYCVRRDWLIGTIGHPPKRRSADTLRPFTQSEPACPLEPARLSRIDTKGTILTTNGHADH